MDSDDRILEIEGLSSNINKAKRTIDGILDQI